MIFIYFSLFLPIFLSAACRNKLLSYTETVALMCG